MRVSDTISSNPWTARRRKLYERRDIIAAGHRRLFEACWVEEEPRGTSSGCSLRTFYEQTGCLPVKEAAPVRRDEPGLGASCSVLTLTHMHMCTRPPPLLETPSPLLSTVRRPGWAWLRQAAGGPLPTYTGTTHLLFPSLSSLYVMWCCYMSLCC